MPSRSNNLALAPGTMLHEYCIEKMIGKGGFGLTYLAEDTHLGRNVAIKELLPDGIAMRGEGSTVLAQTEELEETFQWASDRFLEEARTLARLSHVNIVKVIRYLQANGTVYMVMDFIQGRPLDRVVKDNGGPLPEEQVKAILFSLLNGMMYVHSQGVLHRDIKPGNILITPEGTPVLIDFGSARENIGTVAMTSVVSFGYSPMEQIVTNGRQGPWTDVYSLAATAIFLMTARKPDSATDRVHDSGKADQLVKQLNQRYSVALLQGIEWGFQLRAENRPQSMHDWMQSLIKPSGSGVLTRDSWIRRFKLWVFFRMQAARAIGKRFKVGTFSPETGAWFRARRVRIAAGLLVLIGILISVYLVFPRPQPPPDLSNPQPSAESSYTYYDNGVAAHAAGDDANAISDFDQAIKLDPKYTLAYAKRGLAYSAEGKYDQAITDFSAAIQLIPSYDLPYTYRAYAYYKKGDLDLALADYNRAIALGANLAFNYDSQASIYEAKDEDEQALASYEKVIQGYPNDVLALSRAAWILATSGQDNLRDGNKAVQYVLKAGQLTEWKQPHFLDILAAAYAETGDFANAVKWEGEFLKTLGSQTDLATRSKVQSRLNLYNAKEPYHRGVPAISTNFQVSPAFMQKLIEEQNAHPDSSTSTNAAPQ